jgi:hypothetical protein
MIIKNWKLIIAILCAGVLALMWNFRSTPIKYWFKTPQNFAECTEARGVVLETFPLQCMYNGKSFVDQPLKLDDNPDSIPIPENNNPLNTTQWKQYQSKELGIQFEYPADWVQSSIGEGDINLNNPYTKKIENEIKSGEMYGEGFYPTLAIKVEDAKTWLKYHGAENPSSTNLEEYLLNEGSVFKPLTEINISGIKAFRAVTGGFGSYDITYISYNGKIIEISFEADIGPNGASEEVKQEIFKRFKLL